MLGCLNFVSYIIITKVKEMIFEINEYCHKKNTINNKYSHHKNVNTKNINDISIVIDYI